MQVKRMLITDVVYRLLDSGSRAARRVRAGLIAAAALMLAACSTEEGGATANASAAGEQVPLEVHLTRTCGCCGAWVEHASASGFDTSRNYLEQAELNRIKEQYGISPRLQSCHTAVTESGYVFEGHIPARVIHEFLESPPANAVGLAVPGMPIGSPGMEMGDRFTPYDVLQINEDGSTGVFTHIASLDQQ